MKRNSVMRRLVAGAAGLAVGLVGAVALAAPAQATYGPEGQHAVVIYTCDETKVKVEAGKTNRNWMVNGTEQWLEPGQDHTWALEANADVQIQWWHDNSQEWRDLNPDYVKKIDQRRKCPSGELTPLSSCELFVFVLENTGERDLEMVLIPNQDTTHGHAPTVLGETEIPEGTELVDPQEIMAGGTVGPLGPFEPGTSHAHGFVGVEGLEVQVIVSTVGNKFKDGKVIIDETHAWMPGDCEEPGDGGEGGEEPDDELPVTGTSTTLIAVGALALLALGGGMFLIARRRRVTFTA